MKVRSVGIVFVLLTVTAMGQGTILLDQQSSTDETPPPGFWGDSLQHESQASGGCGQSFTPALSGVDFVEFMFQGINMPDQAGTKVFVNLRADSITGTILGVSAPIIIPPSYVGPVTFLFPSRISLAPGTTYYFEATPPLYANSSNNDPIQILGNTSYNYAGGGAFGNGRPSPMGDLWFREGVIVPEPSSAAIIVAGIVYGLRRRFNRCSSRVNGSRSHWKG